MRFQLYALPLALIALVACGPEGAASKTSSAASSSDPRLARVTAALDAVGYKPEIGSAIKARVAANPRRFLELLSGAEKDAASVPDLLRRADKQRPLGEAYVPADLVSLDGKGLSVSRKGHSVRKAAYEALVAMSGAAKKDGITLLVSSSYRSYEYQKEVFARNAREDGGEAAAERVSARPGYSQHQLGTAIDFGTIDDSFAETRAGRWLMANARRFGYSLSYPKGLEPVTGYRWECWHYRYIGLSAVQLQEEYFGDVQQYLIEFIEAYGK
jgi:D-alanyl-D-alanine carboxypeptidase